MYFILIREVVESAESGVYGVNTSIKQLSNLSVSDLKRILNSSQNYTDNSLSKPKRILTKLFTISSFPSYFVGNFIYNFVSEFLPQNRIYKLADLPSEEIQDVYNFKKLFIKAGICIKHEYLNNCYTVFNDEIFGGFFKKEEEFRMIFEKSADSRLYIISRKYAEEIFKNSNPQNGLSVYNLDSKTVYPLINYTNQKWEDYSNSIVSVYTNLGAKYIKISEIKNTESTVSAKVVGKGKVDTNARIISMDFSFSTIMI